MEDDLTPVELNIRRTRGDSMEPVRVEISYPSPTGPQPLSIEGAYAHVRKKRAHTSTLVLDLPCSFVGNSVSVGEWVALDVTANSYFWDLEVIHDGGKTLTTHAGTFTVLPDVTEVSP